MEIKESNFFGTNEIIIKNSNNGEYVSILPEYGAAIRLLTLTKKEKKFTIIKCGETLLDFINDKSYPSALLFPWSNRVRDGIYRYEDNYYELPINETLINNALHGFLSNKKFTIVNKLITDQKASVSLSYIFDGLGKGYPFPFEFIVEYNLLINNGLEIKFTVKNLGKSNMPFGIGWHPYFTIVNESVDDLQLQLPSNKYFMTDNQMIPAGYGTYVHANEFNNLVKKNYDTVFEVIKNQPIANTILFSKKSNIKLNIWQEAGQNQFRYIVIYTPNDRSKIAIEPMTCNTDAFNNKEGLLKLAPNSIYSVKTGLYLE